MLVKVLKYQYFFDTTFKTILLSKVPKLRLIIQTCTDMNVITNMKLLNCSLALLRRRLTIFVISQQLCLH